MNAEINNQPKSFSLGADIEKALAADGLHVPVIDAIPLTIRIADTLVKSGLSHSKHIYPLPGKKTIAGYSLPDLWR